MKYFARSHEGLRRENNQDSILVMENDHQALLAVVCDGIGGGNAGDLASQMAVAHLKKCFMHVNMQGWKDIDVKRWLMKVIMEANDMIFTQAACHVGMEGMGTTMVGVIYCDKTTYVFNVGDSRTYGLYHDDFLCLTEDHTYVAELLKRGDVSEEEAKVHPNRNMLTNAVGVWNQVKVDISKIKDVYLALLICSDGLHGYVEEDLIQHILRSHHSPQAKVDMLIQASLDAGGFDNVSVIVLEQEDFSYA